MLMLLDLDITMMTGIRIHVLKVKSLGNVTWINISIVMRRCGVKLLISERTKAMESRTFFQITINA